MKYILDETEMDRIRKLCRLVLEDTGAPMKITMAAHEALAMVGKGKAGD